MGRAILWFGVLAGVSLFLQSPSPVQASPNDEFRVYAEHPRLLLKAQKLRLLRRERERQSARWQQFDLLIRGKAQMPEPGFAFALYYQVTGDRVVGRQGVEWALGAGKDLRQLALVFDWCQVLLSEAESAALAGKIRAAVGQTAAKDARSARARVFGAIALAEHGQDLSAEVLGDVVERWWRQETVPRLKRGLPLPERPELYALLEAFHVIRDNTNVDLREDAPAWFINVPNRMLLSYYPAVFPAPENDFRVPVFEGSGDPDFATMAFARAAELAFVGYDANLRSSQFLQGWLMHDQFSLRGPLGAPYEFLWANPYLPGLAYFHMPLFAHDERAGELFLRSSWEDDAKWLGYRAGKAQVFEDGKRYTLNPASKNTGIDIGDATVIAAKSPIRLERTAESPPHVFLVGLKPQAWYLIEVDDEELTELQADAGGILAVLSKRADARVIRIRWREPVQ